jgi:filamentous hemagglutinin family protein
LGLIALASLTAGSTSARGQVVLDGTLGPAGPRVGPNFVVPASVGKLAGTNLFHSFSQFNVNQGESVTFTAPSDVAVNNVLARVTGGSPSNINGLLRSAIPGANFYLINPSGVVFGPEAQLDVSGSFVVTSADRIRLRDGATFEASVSAAAADAVLTSAAPAAFGFLAAKPASITYDGGGSTAGLTVPDGGVLSVIGGDVRITGGTLRSVSGRVNLVSVASRGEVAFDPTAGDSPITLTGFSAGGAIDLLEQSSISVQEGGSALLRGGSLMISHSGIAAFTQDRPGGSIDIDMGLTGPVTLLNARVSSDTVGADAASIRIKGGAVTVRGLSDDALAPISTNTIASGAGGNVTVDAQSITLLEDGSITTLTSSDAPSGSISLNARESIMIDGTNSLFVTGLGSESLRGSDGPAGAVALTAPLVELRRQGEITSTTRGIGSAGAITVTADRFSIDGGNAPLLTGLQSRVGDLDGIGATGHGGDVTVNVKDALTITNGGVISASTFGRGDGGKVDVNAGDAVVTLTGSTPAVFTGIFARSTLPDRGGAGGGVTVNAKSLDVTGPAQISAISTGSGVAGSVTVNTFGSVSLLHGGSVTVQAGFDDPRDDQPPPATPQLTDSGQIAITSGHDVLLESGGVISARATQDSGQVKITAPHHVRLKGSSITAEAGRTGGIIDIDPEAVVLDHSVINGLAAGQDVLVRIQSDVLLTSSSQILTDTAILPPEVDIAGSLVPLNAGLASDAAKLAEICGLRAGGNVSSFVSTGRGGTPLQPGGFEPVLEIRGSK